jgi:hypothetical protein
VDLERLIERFFAKAQDDHRVGPVHISLYFALVLEAGSLAGVPLFLRREAVMGLAKISSRVTYNRCMRELQLYGYIDYMPSFHAGRTKVALIEL